MDGNAGLKFLQALRSDVDFEFAHVIGAEKNLPMDVCNIHGVIINNRDGANAGRGQRLHRGTSQTAGADDQNVALKRRVCSSMPNPGRAKWRATRRSSCSGRLIYSTCSDQVARPSKLDDATACSLFGIRPAAAAKRPASTA